MRSNLRPSAPAIERPMDVLPTPGGPSRQRIEPRAGRCCAAVSLRARAVRQTGGRGVGGGGLGAEGRARRCGGAEVRRASARGTYNQTFWVRVQVRVRVRVRVGGEGARPDGEVLVDAPLDLGHAVVLALEDLLGALQLQVVRG
eukprot:1786060-Prymnesium_polylepis.1